MNHTAPTQPRCPVYLHPAAASNPGHVRAIQQATGTLVVIIGTSPQLHPTTLPARESFGDFGGAA
ncbi:hypothetical protein [Pseudomonas sp. EggHat1]|uniref:hypothetical protein n=1 Tax=Pseudomonas sp. EggHat1 TaxID=2761624 RepID=UPI00186613F2|nr:hypothetical protein [Pseudomonas sp. EggHat1]